MLAINPCSFKFIGVQPFTDGGQVPRMNRLICGRKLKTMLRPESSRRTQEPRSIQWIALGICQRSKALLCEVEYRMRSQY